LGEGGGGRELRSKTFRFIGDNHELSLQKRHELEGGDRKKSQRAKADKAYNFPHGMRIKKYCLGKRKEKEGSP